MKLAKKTYTATDIADGKVIDFDFIAFSLDVCVKDGDREAIGMWKKLLKRNIAMVQKLWEYVEILENIDGEKGG